MEQHSSEQSRLGGGSQFSHQSAAKNYPEKVRRYSIHNNIQEAELSSHEDDSLGEEAEAREESQADDLRKGEDCCPTSWSRFRSNHRRVSSTFLLILFHSLTNNPSSQRLEQQQLFRCRNCICRSTASWSQGAKVLLP